MALLRPQFEVVISGISGKFPECSSVEEFKEKLYRKNDLIKSDKERWNPSIEEKPFFTGKIPDGRKFDATFFGVHPKLAQQSDPMMGLMLERSFEALMDAGVNPFTQRGRNISVISATSLSESEILNCKEGSFIDGLGMIGLSRTMMANRISYFFNFKGPSYNLEDTWSSSVQALKISAQKVALGEIDGAIVVTANLTQYYSVDVEYRNFALLAPDGKCAPFDAEAKGLARSESVVAFFVQRSQDAKRNYGSIIHSKSCLMGDKTSGFITINPQINNFFKEFYDECKTNPHDLTYFETSSFCNKEFDATELNAIDKVFCQNKTSPLLIGSVNGNVGITEGPSGLVTLVKLIIAMETGVIPPTINYDNPNPQVPALFSGKLKPVTEATKLTGDLLAMNNMNICGTVSHVLVKRNVKSKKLISAGDLPPDGLPRLVLLQARHEEGATAIVEKLNEMSTDPEFLSLVNSSFNTPIPAYLWRTYTISPLSKNTITQNIKAFDPTKRPVWFVFSGMGSQWTGMGRELLQLHVFKAAIDKCDEVLRPRGIDIKHILTTNDDAIFENILNCFVGISSVQIGLVDVLRCLGVSPDGMIGHSVGELGCAYADGCLTAQEMILAAYSRGKATMESNMDDIKGMMAAVGMGYNEIKGGLPESIDVACHNSANSCTLSGPTQDVLRYVEQLKQEGVFAKAVSAGGVAYHSRYIKTIGPKLLQHLQEVVPNPKYRSSKWISSSVPQTQWNDTNSKLCSAEYMTTNLLNPVLFEEASQHLPKNAVVIEISPHGLLQAILRRSVGLDVINISLTSRGAQSSIWYLLNSLGQLHINNVDIDINALSPAISYPVSRGTPSLANLITWDHNDDWYNDFHSKIKSLLTRGAKGSDVHINSNVADYQLWQDYCINGEVVVPIAQIIIYAWTINLKFESLDSRYQSAGVVFEDVAISDHVTVDESDKTLMVSFSPTSCNFELSMTGSQSSCSNIIVGKMFEVDIPPAFSEMKATSPADMEEVTSEQVNCLLAQCGLQLGPQFQVIQQIIIGETECVAKVQWTGNMVVFLDALINIIVFLETDKRQDLYLPTYIRKLFVNMPVLSALSEGAVLEVRYNYNNDTLVCEGVQLSGISLSPVPRRKVTNITLNEVKFQPYLNTKFSLEEFLIASFQLVADTTFGIWKRKSELINVLEVRENDSKEPTLSQLLKYVTQSSVSFKITVVDAKKAIDDLNNHNQQIHLVFGDFKSLLKLASTSNQKNVYFLAYVSKSLNPSTDNNSIKCVLKYQSENGNLTLLKRASPQIAEVSVFKMDGTDWLEDLRQVISQNTKVLKEIIIVSRKFSPRIVLPILSVEPYRQKIRTVFILDQDAPKFSLSNPLYSNQLALGLPINILYKGEWGSLTSIGANMVTNHRNLDCLVTSAQDGLEISCTSPNITTFTFNRDTIVNEQEMNNMDYSGYLGNEAVMGVAQFDSKTNKLTVDPILKWSVPLGWTMEDAATVPVIYSLAYYCLHLKGKVQRGENVLIHAGLSPLGQALIAITLKMEGTVFTTVESEHDVHNILKIFPALNKCHIMVLGKDRIDISIKANTAGKGVQLIVNCLRGKYMQDSVRAMGFDCRFLHLGQIQIEDKESVGLLVFLKRTSFHGVSLDNIANCTTALKTEIQKSLMRGIEQGIVKPFIRSEIPFQCETKTLENIRSQHAVEKTVIINNPKLQSKRKIMLQLNPDHLIVLAGEKGEEWMDIAEWLVRRGARRLIMLTEDHLGGSQMRRFNKLIHQRNVSVIMAPLVKAVSKQDTETMLKDILHFGHISHILCINMDESSDVVKNLDLASRKVLPDLQQFVTLLGEGSEVSDSRAAAGLPVCSVKSNSSFPSCSKLLPYLSTLLADKGRSARYFTVSDNIRGTNIVQVNQEIDTYLPSTLDDLHRMGLQVAQEPGFTEVNTRSPGYSHVRYSLLPVFILPGLGLESCQPLLQQLIHPAFCSTLVPNFESVEKLTDTLLKDLLNIQSQGPYNLVGDSWSGVVAIALGCKLEAQGHEVELFLIDGTPSSAKDRLKDLCDQFAADLGTSLLAATLSLPTEGVKTITQLQGWEAKLTKSLRDVPDDSSLGRGLTALYNQLTAVQQSHRPSQLFKGRVTLISCKEPSKADLNQLLQYCRNRTEIFVTGDQKHNQLIGNIKTASIINENMAYSWKL